MGPQVQVRRWSSFPASALGFAGSIGALVFYVFWQISHLGATQYSLNIYHQDPADEWRYTACSRLVEHGYSLFTQVFSAQPPLLFLSLAGGMRIFGDSIAGARWVEILFGVLGLAATAVAAWLIAGPVAGGAAAILLTISPGFLIYSHAIEAEGPMMAFATLSLAVALLYRKTGFRALPVVAGLSLAAGILMKLFAAEVALPALWILLAGRRPTSRNVAAVLSFVAAMVIPVVLEFALVAPRQQWNQVVAMHSAVATASLPNVTPPVRIVSDFLTLDFGLSLLAAAGVLLLLGLRRWWELILFGLWVGGTLVMLLLFRPLFPHHMAILLSSLAVCAGVGFGLVAEDIGSNRALRIALFAVALALYILLLPRLVHADRHIAFSGEDLTQKQLVTFVSSYSSDSDIIATDDLETADRAKRLVAPPLCDPSNVRLHAGYLTGATAIDSTVRYRVRLVVASRGLYVQIPGYVGWLRRHYRTIPAPDGAMAFSRP